MTALRRCIQKTIASGHRCVHATVSVQPQEQVSFDSVATAITPAHGQALLEKGYTVIDGVFNSATCQTFRYEILSLRDQSLLHLNSTHLVKGNSTRLLPKHGIYEAEVADKAIQGAAPVIAAFQRDRTLLTMLSLYLPSLPLHQQLIKVQLNKGDGSCFPLHYDSDESVDSRRLTAILYLNPDWREGDGGELQLYPWPHAPVTVAPLHNRLLIFSTCRMLHRVLPSRRERLCFTTWMSVLKPRAAPPSLSQIHQKSQSGALAADALLAEVEVRKALAMLDFREKWRRSLQQSHRAEAGSRALLDDFKAKAGVMQQALEALGVRDRQEARQRAAGLCMGGSAWL